MLMPTTEHLNKIQLSNISAILEVLAQGNCLSAEVISYWANAAKKLVENQNSDIQYVSLSIFEAINDIEDLIGLAKNSISSILMSKESTVILLGIMGSSIRT